MTARKAPEFIPWFDADSIGGRPMGEIQLEKTRKCPDKDLPPLFEPNRIGWCPLGGGMMFYGPERPSEPGGIGPYTGEVFVFRGYALHKLNKWSDGIQEWTCRSTALSVKGSGPHWLARVAGVTAEGESTQEALDEAWAGAEFEDQLRHLLPPELE